MDAPPRPRPWLVALLLFAAALALYARSAGFDFVEFDDPAYVRDNPHLRAGWTVESVRWAFTSTSWQYNWHPLTWLSHALDVELFGLVAGRHHLVNALLHATNAALLFLALRALSARTWPSAFAAALFALHPLRVESVAWIAQRKDVLAGTFFALTLLAYARHARAPSPGRYVPVALALAAGLMAKPTLVTVPFVLLLLDAWPLRRTAGPRARSPAALVLEKLPLLALSAGSIALTLLAQQAGGAIKELSLAARLANAPIACLTYLGRFLLPRGLAVFYPHPALLEPLSSRLVPALAALAALALLAALAFVARRRFPWLLVGLCWFLGMLVPMIGLVQVGHQALADRYAYLALIGIEVALAWSAAELVRARPPLRAPAVALAGVWLAGLAVLSARQLGTWRSSETLFTRALAVTHGNFVAHNNLGMALGNAGELEQALGHFEAAAALRPGFYEAELNSGKARYARGELALARAAFERACTAQPERAEAWLCLAVTLARLDDRQGARAALERALALQPALEGDARALRLLDELARGPQEGE